MKRSLTCIICPRGCALEAEISEDAVRVTGNGCANGEKYAVSECLHPMRTVTATVRVSNRRDTMVSVKTAAPIPKENMMDVMARLRKLQVTAPVAMGETLLRDVFGTDIIATKAISPEKLTI